MAPDLAEPEFGAGLQTLFGEVAASPMPERLMQLAAELEAAFERGDLGGLKALDRSTRPFR